MSLRRDTPTRALRRLAVPALLASATLGLPLAAHALPAAPRAPKAPRVDIGAANLPEVRRAHSIAHGVTWTSIVRGTGAAKAAEIPTTAAGPWRINVVTIDPKRAKGQLRTAIGADLARPEPTTTLAAWSGALVAMNGSFFAMSRSPAYPGEPQGFAVNSGVVVSEPIRTAGDVSVLMDSATKRLKMGTFRWEAALHGSTDGNAGERLTVNGVNRPPWVPTECRELTDVAACTAPGAVIRFTPHLAARTPSGPGAEVVLDRTGCVVAATGTRGAALSKSQTSIQATGSAAARLLRIAGSGCPRYVEQVRDADGRKVALPPTTFGVTGRYRLVAGGKTVVPSSSSSFFARHPRSMMGRTPGGSVMLVTIDGRSTTSVGATLAEAARVARSLGLSDAVNLDGGGSSAMVVNGVLVNTPSERRERAVGDAVVFLPPRR